MASSAPTSSAISSATSDLAEAVHALVRSPLPDEVRERARTSLLATLGAAIGASRSSSVEMLVEVSQDPQETALIPLLGRPERLTLLDAVTVQGTAAFAGLVGDGVPAGRLVPEPAAMAALVALGWVEDASAARVLTCFAAACEVQTRLDAALNAGDDHPWTRSGPCAPLGAAIAASLLLDLPPSEIELALGIASAQLLGHRESEGTMMEPFLAGKGAANGVHAALLSQAGLTGAHDILEHPRGFFAVLAPQSGQPQAVAEGMGSRWAWLETSSAAGADPRSDLERRIAPVLPGRVDAFVEAFEQLEDATSIRAIVRAGSLAEETA